jgi:Zn-dependent protease with chaperone function
MSRASTGLDDPLLAGLEGRLPRPPLPLAYSLGLVVVSAAMIVLPLLYLAIIAASAWAVLWWAVHGLDLLTHGSLGSLKVRLLAYVAPLVAGGAVPVFFVKPLFSRRAVPSEEIYLGRRDQPLLFAFVERLASVVGAPAPDRVAVDCQVNAGAGLELGLLRREGSALVLTIGLPLVAGLTLPQFASVLAHEFGHFGQGTGMRLARLIRGVNAWFHRVVYERDGWDESLDQGAREGGWAGLAYLGAQLMVMLSRKLLFALMVAGHGISCFLSRQLEFDADQYGARVAGSSVFADTSLRVRVLGAAADFVLRSALGEGRLVSDLPALVGRVAVQAPPRLMAEIRMDMQRSGTGLFDTHPSDLERLRRVRVLSVGLMVRPQEFSLPQATLEGVERTRGRALAIQAEAASGLEAAERALGERVGLAVGALAKGAPALPDAAALHGEAQRLLASLPAFEKAQADAAALRGEAIVLDCLLGNQKDRMGHAGLDEEIHRRLPDVRRAVDALRLALEKIALPGPEWDIPPPWRDDPASHVRSARRALEILDSQHMGTVARLVQITERVEGELSVVV